MRVPLIICSLLIIYTTSAQSIIVPDSLKNVNEIVLEDNTEFHIEALDKSVFKRKYKTIILNSKAVDNREISLQYDDFKVIDDAEVIVRNLDGSIRDSYKLRDFQDYSNKTFSLASDSRFKYLKITDEHYPYMLSVEYQVTRTGSMFYPVWNPQSDENQHIVYASLKATSDIPNQIRHKSIDVSPVEIANGFIWELKNIPAFKYESYANEVSYGSIVFISANDFIVDGFKGNMSTWKSFGDWINQLNTGRNTLSESQLDEIKDIIPENASDLEKTEIVYDWMQDHTRYVSIQLGIGGWRPFESGYVHENKYGDCKALSFYTQALLESVGVDAYYTLINAGSSAFEPFQDFTTPYFNHAILTVPLAQDTIWLECTSQTNPFGYLGTFTSDRLALMVTEDGGHLVKTKNYQADENEQISTIVLNIDESGHAKGSLERTYTGLEIGNNQFSGASLKGASEQSKWFYDKHNWGSIHLDSLWLSPPTNEIVPKGKMSASFKVENLATTNADRLFFKPFKFTNLNYIKLKKDEDRVKDIEIKYPYTQIDTIVVAFPEGFYPESLMKAKSFSNIYGSYQTDIKQDQNTLTITRKCILNKGKYPAEDYEEFRSFIRKVQRGDRAKVVMLGKT